MPKRTGTTEGGVRGLDLSVLRFFYPTSAFITAVAFLLTSAIYNQDLALGVTVGGIFGMVNLALITSLSISVLDPKKQNPIIAFLVLTLKVPIVYGILIALFMSGNVNLLGFAIGFQIFILTLIIYLVAAHLVGVQMQRRKGDETA